MKPTPMRFVQYHVVSQIVAAAILTFLLVVSLTITAFFAYYAGVGWLAFGGWLIEEPLRLVLALFAALVVVLLFCREAL